MIAGTVFGGLGGALDFGSGVIGGLRGIVGGGLFNALQLKLQELIQQAQQALAAQTAAPVSGKSRVIR